MATHKSRFVHAPTTIQRHTYYKMTSWQIWLGEKSDKYRFNYVGCFEVNLTQLDFGLFGFFFFNGISTFVRLFNAKAILQEEQ